MAITWQTPGTAAYSANNGTSVAPAYPAGSVQGDKLILIVGQKPGTANGGGVTTPAGWNLVTSITGAGGYGTTLGADTGNTNLYVFERTVPAGGLTGTLTVTLSNNSVSWAFISRVSNPTGLWETIVAVTGQDTTAGNVSVTFATDPGVKANDLLIAAMCIPTDVTTPAQFSAEAFSQPGITFGTVTEVNEPDSANGNDIGGFSAYALATAGTSTGAPTVTATAGGTTTNVRGPLVFIRVRETILPTVTGTFSGTENTVDFFTAAGSISYPTITGTLTVSETSNDAFNSIGKIIVKGNLSVLEQQDVFDSTGKIIVKGSFNKTETTNDTAAINGKISIKGNLSVSETSIDDFTSSGVVFTPAPTEIFGLLFANESGKDGFDSSGKILVKGTFNKSETTNDTADIFGDIVVKGNSAVFETGKDLFDSAGNIRIIGNISITESGFDKFDGSDYIAIGYVDAGYVKESPYLEIINDGLLSVTESANDSSDINGKILIKGNAVLVETTADDFTSIGDIVIKGSCIITEQNKDIVDINGKVLVKGLLSATELQNDLVHITTETVVIGRLSVSETTVDAIIANGDIIVKGSLHITEANDNIDLIGKIILKGDLSFQEQGNDSISIVSELTSTGLLNVFENISDDSSISGKVLINGNALITEIGNDIFEITLPLQATIGLLTAFETNTDIFLAKQAISNISRTLLITKFKTNTLSISKSNYGFSITAVKRPLTVQKQVYSLNINTTPRKLNILQA